MYLRTFLFSSAGILSLLACEANPPAASPATPPAVAPAPVASAPLPVNLTPEASADGALGELDFTVTGNLDCQRHFREGMLAMHSFLYDQAEESFAAALSADPRCAMAAWGKAMSHDHGLWNERDANKGRAALAAVSDESALTPKERVYLAAARADFDKDSNRDGHRAWLEAAAAMHRDYPEDDEVALQYALALITVYGYDRDHTREQMEAGALALGVLARKPHHPGAAHYVIHAFDNRAHAILALPAAQTYARIAPAASHALHMPSHTFVHLGMWREVVPSNERAYAASVAWETSRGHTPSKYDWHSYSWLVAAHLELGQVAAARKRLEDAGELLAAAKDDSGSLRGSYEGMLSDYIEQTGRWSEAEGLVAPIFAPAFDESESGGGHVCAQHAPGGGGETRWPVVIDARLWGTILRAEASVRQGKAADVEKRLADMKALRAQMAPWKSMISPHFNAELDAYQAELLARAHGGPKPSSEAEKNVIAALQKLVFLQSENDNSGPAFDFTAHELLGDRLLADGKAKEALAEYEKDLEERPNRALGLLGAARAAKATGDAAKAREHYAALADLWKDADLDLPALAEVQAGAK
jgi:tetratricopeptide (TPR) repeat protein